MTTVPPPNVALPQVLAAASAPTMIVIPQPPPALAALPAGTTLGAVVLPPPSPAAAPPLPAAQTPPAPPIVLHTAVGDITVRLPVPVPVNVPVDIEIVRSTPQHVTVRLTAIDNTPALQYLAQNRTAAPVPTVPVAAPQTQAPLGPQPLPLGAMWHAAGPAPLVQTGPISAVVTQAPPAPEAALAAQPSAPPPASAAPQAAPPAPVPQASPPATPPSFATLGVSGGSELTLKIVSVQLPGAPMVPATPQPAPVIPQAPPAAAPPAVAAAAPVATAPPALALAGPQGLPAAPPSPPAVVQPAAPLAFATGTVIAVVDSIPVIAVDEAQVQLNVRANLPVGTKIAFEVTATQAPRPGMPAPLPAMSVPLSGPAGAHTGWPTLIEAVGVLQRSDPAAAQQLAQAIPDGGPRTIAAAISFVQAMRAGDPRQWPGDVSLRALERAGPRGAHLAATLSAEVAELAARARDSGAEWRALPVPWNAGGQIDRVALVTRRDGESDADGAAARKGGGTRFLVDLNLSRLGPMQLDGMFKKELRAFDMVLRTKAALPDEMRRDLIGLFAASNAAMGLKGGLTFQVTKKFADPLGAGTIPDKSGLWA